MNSDYDKALLALEIFKDTGVLPAKFDPKEETLVTLAGQLDALAAEYQDDIDNAQQQLEEIEKFERAWNKVK